MVDSTRLNYAHISKDRDNNIIKELKCTFSDLHFLLIKTYTFSIKRMWHRIPKINILLNATETANLLISSFLIQHISKEVFISLLPTDVCICYTCDCLVLIDFFSLIFSTNFTCFPFSRSPALLLNDKILM